MSPKKDKALKKRLEYLGKMLGKYSHRWGENPSDRMYAWVDEYNDIKAYHPKVFREFCAENGFVPSHDAYDCLA